MLRFLPVLRALGMVICMFGLTMLVPLGYAAVVKDAAQTAFDESALLTVLVGLCLWYFNRHHKRDLNVRDGFLIVVLVWSVLPAFAALPLLVNLDISFTDAYFEAMSGLTTTGATTLSGLDNLPPSINLWRHLLIWLGGMGLIVLAVAVLPLLGIGGRQMFKAETPGPMKDSKLTPRIAQTAKGLWSLYALITIACILGYRWAGMDWFDAVCHAFSTLGLGGFSTHDASFGYWDSQRIESVAIVFMLLAGMNFATHYVAITGRNFSVYARDPEALWFLSVLGGSTLVLGIYLWANHVYPNMHEALRFAAFNVVSIATTTGYASTDFNLWPFFAPLWMLFLCSFATCAGSTGGGIKMIRAILLYKQVYRELLRAMHPNAVYPVKLSGETMSQNVLFAVLSFGFIYMVSLVSLTLLLAFTGLDIITAFSAVVAMVNNTGPGLSDVGPATTYAILDDFQTWVCTFAMLLGRLEIFTLLVVLTPAFWKK